MLTRLLLLLIRAYQRTLSPLFGECCRFEPSCSRYAAWCIRHHGPRRGSWLALQRLSRCNPLFPGGFDPPPVPDGSTVPSLEPDWDRIGLWYGGEQPSRRARSMPNRTPRSPCACSASPHRHGDAETRHTTKEAIS